MSEQLPDKVNNKSRAEIDEELKGIAEKTKRRGRIKKALRATALAGAAVVGAATGVATEKATTQSYSAEARGERAAETPKLAAEAAITNELALGRAEVARDGTASISFEGTDSFLNIENPILVKVARDNNPDKVTWAIASRGTGQEAQELNAVDVYVLGEDSKYGKVSEISLFQTGHTYQEGDRISLDDSRTSATELNNVKVTSAQVERAEYNHVYFMTNGSDSEPGTHIAEPHYYPNK